MRFETLACVVASALAIWVANGQVQIVASDGGPGDSLGNAISVTAGKAIVGACFDDIGTDINQGSAYIFDGAGTNWNQRIKLTAPDGSAHELFGYSVAIDGDTAIVGAPGDSIGTNSGQGSAYVFVRSGNTWVQQFKPVQRMRSQFRESDNLNEYRELKKGVWNEKISSHCRRVPCASYRRDASRTMPTVATFQQRTKQHGACFDGIIQRRFDRRRQL